MMLLTPNQQSAIPTRKSNRLTTLINHVPSTRPSRARRESIQATPTLTLNAARPTKSSTTPVVCWTLMGLPPCLCNSCLAECGSLQGLKRASLHGCASCTAKASSRFNYRPCRDQRLTLRPSSGDGHISKCSTPLKLSTVLHAFNRRAHALGAHLLGRETAPCVLAAVLADALHVAGGRCDVRD